MEPVKPRPPDDLPLKEISSETPYAMPDFDNPEVLNKLTNDLADFMHETGDATIYRQWIVMSVKRLFESLKLPTWMKFVGRFVVKFVAGWLVDNAIGFLVDLLRGIGRKV